MADDKRRPTALNLTPARSASTDSSSSDNSLKPPRTPRFAEATSVYSPVDGRLPFSTTANGGGPDQRNVVPQAQPADVGFGYINNRESVQVPMTPRSPLKSAMKVPGTPGLRRENPLSPTFREEDILEKREVSTEKEQKRDLKIKTRVRLAKFALRGVNFSCSLIILSMLSSSFSIFNATRSLQAKNSGSSSLPSWSPTTPVWPQILVLSMACVSLTTCVFVFVSYCRGGHRRAEKVSTYYTLFGIGWFILNMLLWAITAALLQHSKDNSNGQDIWSWSCKQNTRSQLYAEQVDFSLVCRLQNWTLICIIIEVVVEAISITLYSVVFYRYYTKRRLHKSMNMRDRARSDLYLAQLRTQSAPNTPGFGPKSPAFSQYALSPRFPPNTYKNLGEVEEGQSPFTPGGRVVEPQSSFAAATRQPTFKLQAPPTKAPSATPRTPGLASPTTTGRAASPQGENVQEHGPVAPHEPVYETVAIPGAYAGQALKSPGATQTTFSHAR